MGATQFPHYSKAQYQKSACSRNAASYTTSTASSIKLLEGWFGKFKQLSFTENKDNFHNDDLRAMIIDQLNYVKLN